MRREPSNYSAKEIAVLLNNAVAVSRHPETGDIDDRRLRQCKAFALAMIQPLEDLVNGGIDDEDGKPFPPCIRPEELVCILVAGALYIQQAVVLGTDVLPQTRVTEQLFREIL